MMKNTDDSRRTTVYLYAADFDRMNNLKGEQNQKDFMHQMLDAYEKKADYDAQPESTNKTPEIIIQQNNTLLSIIRDLSNEIRDLHRMVHDEMYEPCGRWEYLFHLCEQEGYEWKFHHYPPFQKLSYKPLDWEARCAFDRVRRDNFINGYIGLKNAESYDTVVLRFNLMYEEMELAERVQPNAKWLKNNGYENCTHQEIVETFHLLK